GAIELADIVRPETQARASAEGIQLSQPGSVADLGPEGSEEGRVRLCIKSLWWYLSRVIHSREVDVLKRGEIEVGSRWAAAPDQTRYWSMVVVSVRSDRDSHESTHYAEVERLVEAFCSLEGCLRGALK